MSLPIRVCLATSIPGPRGTNGLAGAAGADGASASTMLTADFTIPAQGSSADASVEDSSVFSIGQIIYLALAGYFQVTGIPDATTITLLNVRDDAATGSSATSPGLYGGVGDPNGQQFGWQWSHWTGEVDGSEWVKTSPGFGDTGWEQLL